MTARWIDQTIFGDEQGNCLQAALASLLALPLDDVPNFDEFDARWWEVFVSFLGTQGFAVVEQPVPLPAVLGLMVGPSPRRHGTHAVVARGNDVVHDPHPSRDGIARKPMTWWYLVPHDPAQHSEVEGQ